MAAIQLSFSLRTSTNVKTVHLLGSWNNYSGQLPLSKDSSKSGGWKGTFRFQGATLQQGQRYWYYVSLRRSRELRSATMLIACSFQYIMDGYHVSHDPAQPYTTEPTTGRNLNILDVPSAGGSSSSAVASSTSKRVSHSARSSVDIPKGRALSPSNIKHPKPQKPYASRQIREADYAMSPVDELSDQFSTATIDDYKHLSNSPASSVGSSLSSRSTGGSTLSSISSLSSSPTACTCERYGITRKGDRVKLDCGGSRCGYSDNSSGCSSSESESDSEIDTEPEYQEIRPRNSYVATSSRRR